MIRRLLAPLTFAAVVLHAAQAFAQGPFPAPLPGQGAPSANAGSAEPLFALPWQAKAAPDECMQGFVPLRDEAEMRGGRVKAAADRKAGTYEACQLIGDFRQSEIRLLEYVEANAEKCRIPQRIVDQIKTGHKKTEAMEIKLCTLSKGPQRRGPTGDLVPLRLAVNW